jgi:hypothetical protein
MALQRTPDCKQTAWSMVCHDRARKTTCMCMHHPHRTSCWQGTAFGSGMYIHVAYVHAHVCNFRWRDMNYPFAHMISHLAECLVTMPAISVVNLGSCATHAIVCAAMGPTSISKACRPAIAANAALGMMAGTGTPAKLGMGQG